MTAQLLLPDVHHVTGGEWMTENPLRDPMQDKSPGVWWWPVDGVRCDGSSQCEAPQHVHGCHRSTFADEGNGITCTAPPADLVALTEPCDTCHGSAMIKWSKDGGGPLDFFTDDCPDCVDGQPIVQLVQPCPNPYCRNGSVPDVDIEGQEREPWPCQGCWDDGNRDGTVPVAPVTITLLPVVNYDDPSDRGFVCFPALGGLVAVGLPELPDGFDFPFKVEPGQWVARAEEVTT